MSDLNSCDSVSSDYLYGFGHDHNLSHCCAACVFGLKEKEADPDFICKNCTNILPEYNNKVKKAVFDDLNEMFGSSCQCLCELCGKIERKYGKSNVPEKLEQSLKKNRQREAERMMKVCEKDGIDFFMSEEALKYLKEHKEKEGKVLAHYASHGGVIC